MNQDELCFLSIAEAAPLLQKKALSPVELTRAILERIDRLNPELNAFITLTGELAEEQARTAEREILAGAHRGPLHGIPVALKDLFYTRGVRTTAGSRILADFIPDYDATVVELLRAAGSIIVGKTNMHEFAFGADNLNPHFGPTINPIDHDRITGGSSGGSALAVATGLCIFAMGSDTGGSIRIPAACCGVIGLKPTFGLVSSYGTVPLSCSQDTIGPLTRSVADAAIVLNVLAGHDPRDPNSARAGSNDFTSELGRSAAGLRVGVPRNYFFSPIEPGICQLVRSAIDLLAKIGLDVVEIELPMMAEAAAAGATILLAEAATFHRGWLRDRPDDYGADVRGRLEAGSVLLATDYVEARSMLARCVEEAEGVLQQVDVVATPTLPVIAPRQDQREIALDGRLEDRRTALTRLTRPFNLLGIPAIALPCGFTPAGLPASLHLATRKFDEAKLLRIAQAYEMAAKVPLPISQQQR